MDNVVTRPVLRLVLCSLALLPLATPVSCLAADPLTSLLACRAISHPGARLACFDRESARLVRAHRGPRVAGAREPSLAPKRTFGLPQGVIDARAIARGAQPKPLSHLSARIARITRTADGRLLFGLDNGQMWVELQEHGDLLAKPGEHVRISRQMFGSYWMQLPSGRGFKVMRVR